MKIAAIYAALAAVATALNLLAQTIALELYSDRGAVAISMVVGTLAGLVAKYLLDKRYIFKYQSQTPKAEQAVFVLYSATGVFTTAIFWATELGFDYVFNTDAMRYLGGALGLAVGYALKYQLDKRYVFRQEGVCA